MIPYTVNRCLSRIVLHIASRRWVLLFPLSNSKYECGKDNSQIVKSLLETRDSEDEHVLMFRFPSSENTDFLTSYRVTSHFYFAFVGSKLKSTISLQNPSIVQNNYSEKKCSGTLPLSRIRHNMYFFRLIVEQHTGEKAGFQ